MRSRRVGAATMGRVCALVLSSTMWAEAAVATPCADGTPNCVEIHSDRDTSILEGNSQHRGQTDVMAGRIGDIGIDPPGSLRRGLVHFDVAAEPGLGGATILSAELTLCVGDVALGDLQSRTFTLYTVLQDWGESDPMATGLILNNTMLDQATWVCSKNQAGTVTTPNTTCNSSWGSPGADLEGTDVAAGILQSVSVGPVVGECATFTSTPAMVSVVQSWLDQPSSNFGWQVRGDETEDETVRRFLGRESGALAPNGDPPELRLTFSGGGGLPPVGVRIEEVMAGLNGDRSVQYLELKVDGAASAAWGPQGGEAASRMMLTFQDATGRETGSYEFEADPSVGPVDGGSNGSSVLIATEGFAALASIAPDITLPASHGAPLSAVGGQVCFRDNPANSNAPTTNVCLSYGDYATANAEEEDGCVPSTAIGVPAADLPSAALAPTALARTGDFGFGCSTVGNAAFGQAEPAPRNAAGEIASFSADSLVDQGRTVFTIETFEGNGRTCATCHVEADHFGISPERVAALAISDPDDALFVHLNDPNLSDLENDCVLQRESGPPNGRALFLENIDGFASPPSFRNTPHLLNVAATAPYGLSADLDNAGGTMGQADLRSFCRNAVEQHLPRTLARNSDPSGGLAGPALDFREPTDFELEAMEAFQNTIVSPASGLPEDLDGDGEPDFSAELAAFAANHPDRAQDALDGQALFFGRAQMGFNKARCFVCHSGPALAETPPQGSPLIPVGVDLSLLGAAEANLAFDIGTDEVFENDMTACEVEQGVDLLPGAELARTFNTPGLVGTALTAPFFHDHSKATLFDAVRHYNDNTFNLSPAGQLMAAAFNDSIGIQINTPEQMKIATFLEAISIPEPAAASSAGVAIALLGALRRRKGS